jgi:hypothetical protein
MGQVAGMEIIKNAYDILIGKPEGRRLLGKHKRRWKNNIKMFLEEMGLKSAD